MNKIEIEKIEAAVDKANDTSGVEALAVIPELNDIEELNKYDVQEQRDYLKIVLFNAERGKYIDEIDAYMKYHPVLKDADIIFFNELDKGMIRTGNRDTSLELSNKLSMNYMYGVEFLELTKGGSRERKVQGENNEAFHGNAIMSRYKLYDSHLLRLPLEYDWFHDNQKRLGGRMALFTKVMVGNREIGLVCTHLENMTSPKGRMNQMKYILQQAEKEYNDIPVIIAGDMNTNTFNSNDKKEVEQAYINFETETDRIYSPQLYEPLITAVERYGFDYTNANVKGKLTRRKHKRGKDDLLLNLDWFFVKDMYCHQTNIVNTIFCNKELSGFQMKDSEGIEISDHNAIVLKVYFKKN